MKPVVRLRSAGSSCAPLNSRRFLLRSIAVAVLLAGVTFGAPLSGQTVHLSGAVSSLSTTLHAPAAVAVDSAGNIFYAEAGSGSVKELSAASGYAAAINIPGTFTTPAGLAVDSAGNLYVADSTTGTVTQLLAVGGFTTANILGSGITAPTSIAIDPSGNVFVTDAADGTVKEMLASSGYGAATTIASGFSNPISLAIDVSNNVFVLDGNTNIITELLASSAYVTTTTLSASFSHPLAIAADHAGNLFVADSGLSSITELSGTGYATAVAVGAGLGSPYSIATDANGNLIVDDSGNSAIKQIALVGANAGAALVGAPGPRNVYFVFTFDSAGTIAAPSVLTQGSPNLDFTDVGDGTCTTNGTAYTYAAQDICWVDVSFTPRLPGSRYGAVVLSDASSNTLATAYIYGTGTGPQAVFLGAGVTQIDPSVPQARAVALDGAGNLFVATTSAIITEQGAVKSTIPTSAGSSPYSIALDGAGAIYFADPANSRVMKETPSGGGYVETVVSSTVTNPLGVTVDGSGNVYIADTGANRVLKEIPGSSGYTETLFPASALSAPRSVAVDAQGNVYIADWGHQRVLVETPSALSYVETSVGYGFNSPLAIAVGGGGIIYVFDRGSTSGGNRILLEVPASGTYTQSVLATGVPSTAGISVSGSGDVYFGGPGIFTLAYSAPPSLTFPDTAQGATGSPQSITFANIGNAALTFPTPGSGYNPSIASNFTLDSSSGSACPLLSSLSTPSTLAAGATCTLTVSFAPTATGNISGSLVLTDDHLNTVAATQSLSLLGTAVPAVPTITFTVADHIYGDAAFTVAASSPSTGAFTYTLVSGPAILSGDSITVTGTGTVTISVAEAADSNYASGTAITTFNVDKANPTITFGETDKTYGDAAFTVAASSSSSGAFTYSVLSGPVSVSGDTVTITGTGVALLRVSQAATSNYNAASQTAAFTVNAATPTITFTVADKTFGDAPFAVSASSASTGVITYTIVSGPASVSGDTVTLTGAGSVTILASQAADSNYTAATQAATFNVARATTPITFTAAGQTFGAIPFTVAATSASSGAFTYTVASGPATISGSLVTLTGAGSVTLLASQAADTNYAANTQTATFTVAAATPTIAFTVAARTFGDAPFTLSASSASAGAFTYAVISGPATIAGNTVTLTGAGAVVLSASQAADGNYAAATQNATFNAALGSTSLAFTVPNHLLGDAPFSVNATSSSTGAITYTLVSGAATVTTGGLVTLTGTGTVVLTATQAADANYASATRNATFNVMAATIWVAGSSSVLSAFDVSGAPVSGSGGFTGGGLGSIAAPLGMAFDHTNSVWVANMSGGVSKFNSDGTPVGSGFSGGGITGPRAIAVDGDGQVWTANSNGSVSALTNTGSAISPGSGYRGEGLGTPGAIAVDLSGNVWVTNTSDDSVTELIGVAAPAAPLSASASAGARP